MESLEDSHRRDGFEVGNADKIFESTYIHDSVSDQGASSQSSFEQSAARILDFLDLSFLKVRGCVRIDSISILKIRPIGNSNLFSALFIKSI